MTEYDKYNHNFYTFITDALGNLITETNLSPFLKIGDINIPINQKKLLANILDKNYSIFKTPILINNNECFQYILDRWKLYNTFIGNFCNKNIIIKNYNSFSDFEQEMIFVLLNGHISDKEIEKYLLNYGELKGNIRYTVANLYEKFEVNNKTALLQTLLANNYDTKLPISMFKPGIYDFN